MQIRIPQRLLDELDMYADGHHGGNRAEAVRDILVVWAGRRQVERAKRQLARLGVDEDDVRARARANHDPDSASSGVILADTIDRTWHAMAIEHGLIDMTCVDCGQPVQRDEPYALEDRGPYHGDCTGGRA